MFSEVMMAFYFQYCNHHMIKVSEFSAQNLLQHPRYTGLQIVQVLAALYMHLAMTFALLCVLTLEQVPYFSEAGS